MPPKSASRTAFLVAGYRARASAQANPVCSDPWAGALAGAEGAALAEHFGAQGWRYAELWTALRTAFIDREVIAALNAGVAQVAVLGAGLDSRAARLGRPGVRFFEVDQPASQAEKLACIAAVPGYPREAATYASVNFEHEDFLDVLAGAGFDTESPAMLIWEGVTMYLGEPAIRATLGRIAYGCHPGSRVVFDTVGRKLVEGQRVRPEDAQLRASLDGVGEPLRFGIDDVLPLCFEEGFRYVRSTPFDEIALEFTGTWDRERAFRFQKVTVASRTPP